MTRIDDLFLKCVFYVYMSKEDAFQGHPDSATGFFLGIPSSYDNSQFYIYAITNKHVIKHNEMETPILRVNNFEGTSNLIETKKEEWRFHPLGSDLAICLIDANQLQDTSFLSQEFLLTNEFMEEKNVGVGDDVFVIGNFQTRGGKTRNYPTVRLGNIAQMPNEPLKNPYTTLDEESFIIELHSTSGYSGSPVILSIPWIINRKFDRKKEEKTPPKWHNPEPDYYRLLGIDWGHIQTKESLYNSDGERLPNGESIWINSAMAGVVPSWKIAEMLYSEEEEDIRKKEDEQFKMENGLPIRLILTKEKN